MKRNIFIFTLLALLFFPYRSDSLTLVYSDHEPLGNMRTVFLNDVFFKAVKEFSGGQIEITPYWNSEISTGYDALKILSEGREAQIAVIVPEYASKELPLHQIFKSFPTGPYGQKQVEFFRNVYNEIPELVNELEANNLHAVFIATGYPAAFFSVKKLDDLHGLSGQKWRSASFWHKDFLANAGAVPVTMAWGQGVFEALNNGTLDGLIVNIDSGYDIKAHTAAPYILTSQKLWLGHEYIIAMNKKVWDSLNDSEQNAFIRAAESSYRILGRTMNEAFARQLDILRSDGAVIRIMSDDEISFWEKITDYRTVQDKYINNTEVMNSVRTYMKNFKEAD